MANRASVSLKEFLAVTVQRRDEIGTVKGAAAELGLTEASFKMRLKREREDYPTVFEGVEAYPVGAKGRTKATIQEAMELLAELANEADVAADLEGEDGPDSE